MPETVSAPGASPDAATGRTRWVTGLRVACIIVLVAAITAGHAITGRATHQEHLVHVVLRLAYLLPILLGAVWYGIAGAVTVTAGVSGVYLLHMATAWLGASWENANQLAMLGVFWVLGLSTGVLVAFERRSERLRRELRERMQREILVNGLNGLEAALKSRDEYTGEHGEAVSALGRDMAQVMGLAPERVELVRLAGLVHDLGKIGMRDDVLFKADALTPAERERMHQHPVIAANILAALPGARPVARIVRAHHEYLDGSGYPDGLRGEQIPLEARILTVADIFCAVTDEREYHRPMTQDEALALLEQWSGSRVAPEAVRALRAVLDRHSYHPIRLPAPERGAPAS